MGWGGVRHEYICVGEYVQFIWVNVLVVRRCAYGNTCRQMFAILYGKTAAGLYARAAGQNAKARQLYNASADTYYKANDAAAYDDWVRARNHWDYFYNR